MAVIDDARLAEQDSAAIRDGRRDDAAMDERHFIRFEPERRKRVVDLREKRVDFVSFGVLIVRLPHV